MSYNPNKSIDTSVCKGIEKLYDALKAKGITLKSIEVSRNLTLFGTPMKEVVLDVGPLYNRKHVKIKTPQPTTDKIKDAK